jgi:hypothetical protein
MADVRSLSHDMMRTETFPHPSPLPKEDGALRPVAITLILLATKLFQLKQLISN